MKKVAFPLLFFAISCGVSSRSNIIFVDSVGHSALIFDKNIKKYNYIMVGSDDNSDKNIENCSSVEFICVNGPFYLKFSRANIPNGMYFESSDGKRTCKFTFRRSGDDVEINSFLCKYANGAPSPEYKAVRISDSGQMSPSALSVKAIFSGE